MRFVVLALAALAAAPAVARADEPVDLEIITRIRDEGFRRSQVMEIARHLTDVLGSRITGSPAMTRAHEWTRDTMAGFGMKNARLESYAFGRGWSWSHCSLDLLGDAAVSLSAIPQGWTPGTTGPVEGEAVRLKAETAEDLEPLKGTLAGKFVLLDDVKTIEPRDEPPFERYDDDDLAKEVLFEIPDAGPEKESPWRRESRKRFAFRKALDAFLAEEGALGILEVSSRNHGIVRTPRGGEPTDAEPKRIPAVTVMTEQYNRLVRLVDHGEPVRLRLDVGAAFHENEGLAYNTVAEIPGKGRPDEVVILGAHLDSYQSGTGATDNAGGCAVMMEAARILLALDVQPKRTIRVALWSGEEQGLLGSWAYVNEHFAPRPAWPDSEMTKPQSLRSKTGPLAFTPEHAKVSAYYNLDNGGGKIRGIYLEENAPLRPIFEAWLEPFRDLGVTTVTLNRTGGTDHQSFDRAGIPGFQFMQDPMDYMPQTHHSNLDTFDHLSSEDLRQAAVVVAAVAIHTANRPEKLPRKPRPTE